ncbi:hypothetical protein JAAARDRAFT_207019 [Jaapia argillacea MUCL 33604]|uniref:G-protein coupled receptors family 1 profile domain-containing protein n=1 Tax=Jaapia argillacea MUCL 33604 TaxID=933084 RepID=A0A067Q1Y0_9AGAM|nr:hypothetical protein JAAARDRAFT_207019 [Jaapia argillacea MUCL 33604]
MCGLSYYIAYISSLWVETILYGIFVTVFTACLYLSRSRKINPILTSIASLLFLTCTTHLLVQFVRVILSPVVITTTQCIGSNCSSCNVATSQSQVRVDELNRWNALSAVLQTVFVTNQAIADGLLIYRCFIVYQRKYRYIIVPTILVITASVIGYIEANVNVKLYFTRRDAPLDMTTPPPHWFPLSNELNTLTVVWIIVSIITNIFVTALIVARIWIISREVCGALGKKRFCLYQSTVAMIVESGAIYSTTLCVYLVMHLIWPSSFEMIAMGVANQIVGIVPTLIIVRVALGRTIQDPSTSNNVSPPRRNNPTANPPDTGRARAAVVTSRPIFSSRTSGTVETMFTACNSTLGGDDLESQTTAVDKAEVNCLDSGGGEIMMASR